MKYLITAAGGNGTVIEVISQPLTRAEYERRGIDLGKEYESRGAEQAGFLVAPHCHFEMAGGEFCGNATRAAAVLLFEEKGDTSFDFTVSGFSGTVSAEVAKLKDRIYEVTCRFPGLPTDVRVASLADGAPVTIVDLGGIVHVVIEQPFVNERAVYEAMHRSIVKALGLQERGAVGVLWISCDEGVIRMDPVVWVRAINTFFYESSCGSGTVAVAKVTKCASVVQPSGKRIDTIIDDGSVTLKSEMEVVS